MGAPAVSHGYIEKLRSLFPEQLVYKSPSKNKFLNALGIPSYLRDWLLMKFADRNTGDVDVEQVSEYVNRVIPRREQWESLKTAMIREGASIRLLAKLRVEIDVRTGEALFQLPDLGFPARKYEAVITQKLLRDKRDALVASTETWGVIELSWDRREITGLKEEGRVFMTDFIPFRPYQVDLQYFKEVRAEFSTDEWVDIVVAAMDYRPEGVGAQENKLTIVSRLLPFVEKRLNLIELAPKGTGKSYVFSQISKYGWLVSGGSITRARLFYDVSRKAIGLVSRYDYVALDEIQSIAFPDEEEVRGALKGYLESGEYRVGDYRGVGDSGFVLLGNISDYLMDENKNMFRELPAIFQESALLDRFHGFIKGWNIPRMRENMKAEGWGLNVEYFSEIMHELRSDLKYRSIVDDLLAVPRGADTRDTEAVKRLATGFMKILFPHVASAGGVDMESFQRYCLRPALEMRAAIRKQLHILDPEYPEAIPDIQCAQETTSSLV
ncbi:MAG: BREX system Lon protease-like protein BrxL [Desulfomonilaceae bacterium]